MHGLQTVTLCVQADAGVSESLYERGFVMSEVHYDAAPTEGLHIAPGTYGLDIRRIRAQKLA